MPAPHRPPLTRATPFALVLLLACAPPRESSDLPPPDAPIPVDSVSEFGFSANDVAALVGSRAYRPVAEVGADYPGLLLAHSTVTVDVSEVLGAFDHPPRVVDADRGHELWALVRFSLRTEDGQIDVSGDGILAATALDAATIAWAPRDVTDSATGVLPSWTETASQTQLDEGVCGDGDVTWQQGHRSLYLWGAVETPVEVAQVYWTEPGVCGAVATLDRVALDRVAVDRVALMAP